MTQVKKTCRVDTVNAMLAPDEQRNNWEVLAIAPQVPEETFYRCIFGRGYKTGGGYQLQAIR